MNRIWFALLLSFLTLLFLSAALAARADYSGEWRLDPSRSQFGGEAKPQWMTVRIQKMIVDSESDLGKSTGTAEWKGDEMVVRGVGKAEDRYRMQDTPGLLSVERRIGGHMQLLTFTAAPPARHPEANFDEAKVGSYVLPDSLKLLNGERVTTAEMWNRLRRPQLIHLFEDNMYGRSPEPPNLFYTVAAVGKALEGKAIRKEVTLTFPGHDAGAALHVLIYLPAEAKKPVPLFLGLNFAGNAATEPPDGKDAAHWPYAKLIANGYGLATMWTGDMAPDNDKELQSGVYAYYYKPGQTRRAPGEWGAVAAWAWGLSRAMDYFETDSAIDAHHVAVMGHSRNGKAAVWAGALDTRFAMVISNESGEGGAAVSRRNFGETIQDLNTNFPHWFCENYRKFNGGANPPPVDSNLLLSLVAPRPLYVASAQGDLWSDPKGEFLGALGATPVYQLLGAGGLAATSFPGAEKPIISTIGYHMRTGKHDVTDYDWEQYIRFAAIHMYPK